jgi:hypothetical protein
MIQLFPDTYDQFVCPQCKSYDPQLKRVIFQGIHLLADLRCDRCGFEFYHDFPFGQALTTPVILAKNSLQLISPKGNEWFTEPLIKSLQSPVDTPLPVSRKMNRETGPADTVIFLNCLDAWYGHVLLKLMNIQFYYDAHPQYKKIVLVPKAFAWMVPAYVDEVWSIDLKLSQAKLYYLQLDEFINQQLKQYKAVYLAAGYSHPQLQKIRAEDFFGIKGFDLANFQTLRPRVTLIYREDRLWLGPFFNKLYTALNYRKLTFANKFFLGIQARKFKRLVLAVKNAGIDAEFVACGLGKSAKLDSSITDRRANSLSEQEERDWCRIYAESHLVVGMHGSNMLIPSALAAAWVEILPNDRLGNITQDLFCKYDDSTMHFMGRFVSEYDPVDRVAKIICSIFNDYKSFQSQKPHKY